MQSHPCSSADTLELLATLEDVEDLDVWGLSRSEKRLYFGNLLLQPESFIVHVPGPGGRTRRDLEVIWSTVNLMDLRNSQTRLTPSWRVAEAVTVTAPGGGDAPGRWVMRSGGYDSWDAVDSSRLSYDAYPLSDLGTTSANYVYDFEIQFWALGTYKVLFEITGSLSGTTYTDSGTYTFHVGPVADLEVRDAGPNPEVAAGRRAYTVMAVNNGPDIPPGVEVTLTGVPQGAEVIPSEGSYRNGVWYIEDLSYGEAHRASGHRTDGPTLTVIAESDAPVSASIAAVGEYCVRIKTPTATDLSAYLPVNDLECKGALPSGYTEHTTNYFDYNDENSKDVEIAAHAGTGAFPGAPRSLTAVETPAGNILWWKPVGRVNNHPVTHYEVQRREEHDWVYATRRVKEATYRDEYFATAMPRYRVRAVNWMGVGGPWSQPTEEGREQAQPPDPVQPPDPGNRPEGNGRGRLRGPGVARRLVARQGRHLAAMARRRPGPLVGRPSEGAGLVTPRLHGERAGQRHGVRVQGARGDADGVRRARARGVVRHSARHADGGGGNDRPGRERGQEAGPGRGPRA